jgi:hypothetical protein
MHKKVNVRRKQMSTKAGEGNNQRFILTPQNDKSNKTIIQEGKDYLSVSAVMWYINQQGNFFSNHMVAGALEFSINGQNYSTVLGSYHLNHGQKTAPIFDQPIVP